MAKSRIYPPASRTAQWWETKYSRGTFTGIDKLLLHTTETSGWPAYGGGASAPTLTYNPWVRQWRQHNYLNTSARALQDPSSTAVRENRDNVVQVEIIAYCDPKLYAKYGHGVNALPATFYEDMGAFLAFLNKEWGTPIVRAPEWDTFPPSNSIRMSSAKYDAFRGVLGHQHASGNSHGDPGLTNAQADRILAVAKRLTKTTTTDVPGDDMPLTDTDKAWLRANMDDSESDYAVRFWVLPSGTGTALINTVKQIALTVARIEDDTDGLAAIQAKVDEVDASLDAMKADAIAKRQALEALSADNATGA